MFFYGGIDNFRHTSGAVLNARYPTAQERSGNLSALLQRTDARGVAAPITIYDPLTGQPFPGNVIPSNRISPVAAELLKMIPDAATPGRLTDFNAVFFKPQFDNSDKYDARFDWEVNAMNRLFARTTIAHLDQASRFSGSVPGDYGYSTKNQWTHAAAANWTRIFSPSTVGTMQFTFRSMPFKNIPSRGDETFGVPINDVNAQPPFGGPPAIVIGSNGLGISELFDRLLFNYSADYGYTFDPTVTKTIANHTIKAGFTFLRGYKTQELASPPYGNSFGFQQRAFHYFGDGRCVRRLSARIAVEHRCDGRYCRRFSLENQLCCLRAGRLEDYAPPDAEFRLALQPVRLL
jgi:hypothetical protein